MGNGASSSVDAPRSRAYNSDTTAGASLALGGAGEGRAIGSDDSGGGDKRRLFAVGAAAQSIDP